MSDLHGQVHWSELMTRDVDKVKAYYTAVCGWSFETVDMGEGDYHVASSGDKMVAGIMDMTGFPGMEEVPAHWLTYIAVDDVDAAAKDTQARGGVIQRAPWDVAGVGRIALLSDPGGAVLGLMTPSDP